MPLQVVSTVSDRERVDKRRAQILRAATELFGERDCYVTTVRADVPNVQTHARLGSSLAPTTRIDHVRGHHLPGR